MRKALLISFISCLAFPAFAEKLKLGFTIDPALGLKVQEVRGQEDSASGFVWRGSKDGTEVSIRGTTLDSLQAARELSHVEFSNIARLYGKRGNPYEGQISSMITCEKQFVPVHATLKIDGQDRPVLLVGANSRKSFGACSPDQVAYWAAYYNYVDEPSKTVFSVRIFREMKTPTAKNIESASRDLKDIAPRVLMKEPR